MPLFSDEERALAETVSQLQDANPFLPERLELERRALGDDFVDTGLVWHRSEDFTERGRNLEALARRMERLTVAARKRLTNGESASDDELRLYEDLALYHIYHRYQQQFHDLIERPGAATSRIRFFDDYRDDAHFFLGRKLRGHEGEGLPGLPHPPSHLFALSFQIRRAFHYAIRYILGGSLPAAQLRAQVWQSVFSHDMRRYRRVLYERMDEITTLVTGPSGTGKELVAQAVGRSRYIPFDDAQGTFVADPEDSFYPLNLSALSPTLIESELFGHVKGSFTGATADRRGWLEICTRHGTVFLDEIGEVDPSIQVKLLRLLQNRTYQRLGETLGRTFRGKIVAATNRDLAEEIRAGRFRQDFYYRLCADQIVTPSLSKQLLDSPGELRNLLELLAARMVGDDEAPSLARETQSWIDSGLPPAYTWPGNVRELEQCVRNVLIRREYHPPGGQPIVSPARKLADDLECVRLTAGQLLARYCTLAYEACGSYSEAGRRLGLDRRTVRSHVDQARSERQGEEIRKGDEIRRGTESEPPVLDGRSDPAI
ncbi:MAG: sigma 54-interacting transcriptional regulator [Thermoanaerobaculia bacterium]|nr:sigma 54-interacting transcriptional regulator [Thermoanaerobaculia bacterium]